MQNKILSLPYEVVSAIKGFIAERRNESSFRTAFPNPLLREDVLELLDKYCTVVYYPIPNEENNGFHITGIPNRFGEDQHFVFINTAQTVEKQVFTAAHELGHIWNVDDQVCAHCDISPTEDLRERIISRFAAELLMPETEFAQAFSLEFEKYKSNEHQITVANTLRLIVALMNHFFVPRKAVVYRFFELEIFPEQITQLLLGEGDIPDKDISEKVNEIIRDNGYVRFQKASEKKWISGLSELLDFAETNQCISQSKIQKMRQAFSLEQPSSVGQMTEIVEIKTTEGCDSTNDNR